MTEVDESKGTDDDLPLCMGCGYRLDHLESERCPECGGAFDLQDPNTFRTSRRRLSNRIVFAAAWIGIPIVAAILTVSYDVPVAWGVVNLFLAIPYAVSVYVGSRGQRWVFYPSTTLLAIVIFIAVVPEYGFVISPGADGYAELIFSMVLGSCCFPTLLGLAVGSAITTLLHRKCP